MKSLKLNHDLALAVLDGSKRSTVRLFDDKDLHVGDVVKLIDKVDPNRPATWCTLGEATIDQIIEKRLSDVDNTDLQDHEEYNSPQEMLDAFRNYYGNDVTWSTTVKIIRFAFRPNDSGALSVPMLASGKVRIFADGGSRGNPGPSASGYVVIDPTTDKVLVDKGVYLGITTNNQAEYQALRLALEECQTMGAREVEAYMDSLLVINQMKGVFKVRNRDLWPIHNAIKELARSFAHISFSHVPREFNKLADAAVNRALDEELGITNTSRTARRLK